MISVNGLRFSDFKKEKLDSLLLSTNELISKAWSNGIDLILEEKIK